MKEVTFVTGNRNKVAYLEKYLGIPVPYAKVDLDEIQSLDVSHIVAHKARQAYEKLGTPVLVEDGSLSFEALGGLPGPFIRFFVEAMPLETLCSLLDGKSRRATARVVFGFCDGGDVRLFEGSLEGEIAAKPAVVNGWDWDKIFIPEGYTVTRAELDERGYEETIMKLRPLKELKDFLMEG